MVLGEHNTDTDIDCTNDGRLCADPVQSVNVAESIPHPSYEEESDDHHYDIGLVVLKKGAKLTS